jgi:Bacterial cellulose synthase subunit
MQESVLGTLALFLAGLLFAHAQPGDGILTVEQGRCALIEGQFERVTGESKDIFLRLPEHVNFRPGSELHLVVRPSPQLLAAVSELAVSINGRQLSSIGADDRSATAGNDPQIQLQLPVPEEALGAGWNRISLQFLFKAANREAIKTASWSVWGPDSYLLVAYSRMPLFPELLRFPHSMAEEKLLHQTSDPQATQPTLLLLLPVQHRDVHLRACAILGARLGQLGYLSDADCRLALMPEGQQAAEGRNAVIVGRWDELGNLPILSSIAEKLAALKAGQGMLAEFILGKIPNQNRWVLATGADDAGLEKAILTLASTPALASAPPNPAVIELEPVIPAGLETEQKPGWKKIPLKDVARKEVILRGDRSEKSFSGWWFPAGHELAAGSFLNLRLGHSEALTNSTLEVLVNGSRVGQVALTPENAASSTATVPLPAGLPTRDPMIVTLRCDLPAGDPPGSKTSDGEAWVSIASGSTLEANLAPLEVTGLHQINQWLVRDRFLRKAAFLLPLNSSVEELQMLFDLSRHLGNDLSSSPILWPEACGYSSEHLPPASRLEGRSVILLGSASQWRSALPAGSRLALEVAPDKSDSVSIQGRGYKLSAFEPTAVLLQMRPSPWSVEETMVVAGGWRSFAVPALKRLFAQAAQAGQLYGNLCALDANGRSAAYDTRRPSRKSFAERLLAQMPPGLSVDVTNQKLALQNAGAEQSAHLNTVIVYGFVGVLLLSVCIRLLLLWERERSRKKSMQPESPLANPP